MSKPDPNYSLASFVEQRAKINRGRAFLSTPERPGEYILVDDNHIKQQRQTRGTAS